MTHSNVEPIPVKLTSIEDGVSLVQATKEVEPEHWVIRTAVIPPLTESQEGGGAGAQAAGNGYQQVLNTDLLRKDAVLYFPDGPVILCHSEAQASDAANYGATTPFPEGGYFPINTSTPNLTGTAAMWAVNPGNTTIRVTIVTNRRGA